MSNRSQLLAIVAFAIAVLLLFLSRKRLESSSTRAQSLPMKEASQSNIRKSSATSKSAFLTPGGNVQSADVARAAEIESDIEKAYFDWVRLNPEADLYLSVLEKAGTPEDCRWRAFLVLSDFCTHLSEIEFDIKTFKKRGLDLRNADELEPADRKSDSIEELEARIKAETMRLSFFKTQVFKNLRRFNPSLTDETCETLVRFRPAESVLTLPRFESNEIFIGY